MPTDVIVTGIDKLARLIDTVNRISISKAATQLKASPNLVEEWAKMLEKEGLVSIEYKLTVPYIVKRELSPQEVKQKVGAFKVKRDVFVQKGEFLLNFINKESAKIESVQKEYAKLKKKFGAELATVKEKVRELESAKAQRLKLKKDLFGQKDSFLKEAETIRKRVAADEAEYKKINEQFQKRHDDLMKKKADLAKMEKWGQDMVSYVQKQVADFNKRLADEQKAITGSKTSLRDLDKMATKLQKKVNAEHTELQSMIDKAAEKERKIIALENEMVRVVKEQSKTIKDEEGEAGALYDHFVKFVKRRTQMDDALERLIVERGELQKSLQSLILKSKTLGLLAASSKGNQQMLAEEIKKLESNFDRVEEQSNVFEKQIQKLIAMIKGK